MSVHGYVNGHGTYVAPHMRSHPDGNFGNNWSTKGNYNPYTGVQGTKTHPNPNHGTYTHSGKFVPRSRAVGPTEVGPTRGIPDAGTFRNPYYNGASSEYLLNDSSNPQTFEGNGEGFRAQEWLNGPVAPSSSELASRGFQHFRAREYDQAISAYSRALELDDKNPRLYYCRGIMYNYQRDHGRAIADLREAVRLSPEFSEAHIGLDYALKAQSKTFASPAAVQR